MPVHVFFVTVLLLTVVNCQSEPQFESGGRILPNNSYIYYANISDGDNALKCVTDSDNWGGGSPAPQGAVEATCLYVTRGHGVVSLNRKSDCIPESSGLWRCDIPDSSEVMQNIYVYINNDASSGQMSIDGVKSVRFILHTEPSVSPPEFTIICRSKGGPATNVLWKRPNGERVQQGDSDHETSQIIVDTRSSVYENRLRVRGREGETYFCIISNNIKDYFPSLNLTNKIYRSPGVEVTKEPTSFNATSKSNSTHVNITVTWKQPMGPCSGYVIYYQPMGGEVHSVKISNASLERYILTGLQRGVIYNISIVALFQLPSPVVGPISLHPATNSITDETIVSTANETTPSTTDETTVSTTTITPSTPSSETTATSTSCTDNNAVVTGGVVIGLIIIIQSVMIVFLALRLNVKIRRHSGASSIDDNHNMVMTSCNTAYGVMTVEQEHEYEVMELQKTCTHHTSSTNTCH